MSDRTATKPVRNSVERAYWRRNFQSRPYVRPDSAYKDYQPAYRYGWESHSRANGRTWDAVMMDVREGWEQKNGQSRLSWSEAGGAVRDAWERIDRRFPR